MIPEHLEELASLYVLEVLTPAELQKFEAILARDPELQALVRSLRATRDALAGTIPPIQLPPDLKSRILAKIENHAKKSEPAPVTAPETKVMPLPVQPEPSPFFKFWLPWAMAAALMVVAAHFYQGRVELKRQLDQQTARVETLNQLADSLRNVTNSLSQAMATLKENTRMKDLRIALLSSLLNDAPKAVAVSLWDNQQQSGVFIVQNLKPLPSDRDYQLWVIDPQYQIPVSAGVFKVDSAGNVRVQFKAEKSIATAGKFAVTMESKGGSPTPTLKNLVLIGG